MDSELGSRAVEAKQRGDLELAETLYLQAQAQGDLISTTNLGILYWQQGRFREANNQFIRAADAGYGAALWDLGNMYREVGLISAAVRAWESSLPFQDQAFQSLLAINAQRGQFDVALGWAERGIEAGLAMEPVRDQLLRDIDVQLQQAPGDAVALAEMFIRAEQLATGLVSMETQRELVGLRWDAAAKRPLGPGRVDSLFNTVSVTTALGLLRPAGQVLPSKGALWGLAADACAVLLGELVDSDGDTDEIVAAASATSQALQESLTLDPRELNERELLIVDNISHVMNVVGEPLGVFYELWMKGQTV